MADPFACEADEVKTVDALVDLFPVEHAAAKFFDADAEKLFVIFLYFASSGFVTWKIFIFRLIVRAVIDIVMAPVFAAAGAFFLCPWHLFFRSSLDWLDPLSRRLWKRSYFIMNGLIVVNSN